MLIGVLSALIMASSAAGQCFSSNDTSGKKALPEARTSLYRGQLEFTLNVFNAINKAVPEDNIFFSPFSVYQSLLLAYFSAGGSTVESLREALVIDEKLVSTLQTRHIVITIYSCFGLLHNIIIGPC